MSKNSKVITYKIEDLNKLIIIKENNDFIKTSKALRRYLSSAYKYVLFQSEKEVLKFAEDNKIRNKIEYKIKIPCDPLFCKVYGDIYLVFEKEGPTIQYKRLEPFTTLKELYMKDVPVKNGVPILNSKARFKIEILSNALK